MSITKSRFRKVQAIETRGAPSTLPASGVIAPRRSFRKFRNFPTSWMCTLSRSTVTPSPRNLARAREKLSGCIPSRFGNQRFFVWQRNCRWPAGIFDLVEQKISNSLWNRLRFELFDFAQQAVSDVKKPLPTCQKPVAASGSSPFTGRQPSTRRMRALGETVFRGKSPIAIAEEHRSSAKVSPAVKMATTT